MSYNYSKIAEDVIKCIGGQENIKSVAHCATRLRIIVVDKEIIDEKGIGDIEGAKGTFLQQVNSRLSLAQGMSIVFMKKY